jgi:hypothetical protein
MMIDGVPNKNVPDEGGIIVEGVVALELKRSRVQHTVFTVSVAAAIAILCYEHTGARSAVLLFNTTDRRLSQMQ